MVKFINSISITIYGIPSSRSDSMKCPDCGEKLRPYGWGIYKCPNCGIMSINYVLRKRDDFKNLINPPTP